MRDAVGFRYCPEKHGFFSLSPLQGIRCSQIAEIPEQQSPQFTGVRVRSSTQKMIKFSAELPLYSLILRFYSAPEVKLVKKAVHYPPKGSDPVSGAVHAKTCRIPWKPTVNRSS